MPADSNIFSQYLKAPKSVMEYQAENDQAQVRKNALQLAAMDLSEKTQANQRAQQVRNALMGLGGAATDEQRISTLRGTGTPEGFTQADALGKMLLERQKTVAGVKKDTAQTVESETKTAASKLEQSIKAHDFHLQQLGAVNDPVSAKQWAIQGLQSGVFTPEQFAAGFQNIPTDPAQFAQWKQRAIQGGVSATEQLKLQQAKAIADQSNTTSIENNKRTVGASLTNAAATRDVAQATRDAANTQRDQNTEMKLGDDYRAQSKNFKETADAYKQITAVLDKATTSPAATLAGATKFMKMIDPGSVVRESELGMALAATGVFDRASNYFNTLQRGKVLTASQVADFKNITKQINDAASSQQKLIDKHFSDVAKGYKLRPEMVIQDYGQNAGSAAAVPPDIANILNKHGGK